jgi:hypothetical protein
MRGFISVISLVGLLADATGALEVDFDNQGKLRDTNLSSPWNTELRQGMADSIKAAASTVAFGLLKYYTGNNTGDVAGNLPDPYFCM